MYDECIKCECVSTMYTLNEILSAVALNCLYFEK